MTPNQAKICWNNEFSYDKLNYYLMNTFNDKILELIQEAYLIGLTATVHKVHDMFFRIYKKRNNKMRSNWEYAN